MKTHFVTNFPESELLRIRAQMWDMFSSMKSHWCGTVRVGDMHIGIDCRIQNVAEKMSEFFVHNMPGANIDTSDIQMHLFTGNPRNIFAIPDKCECVQIFSTADINSTPDIIVTPTYACIVRENKMLFMAAPEQNNPLVTLVMGENHLLMRQIRHMLYHTSHFFMHGAVVGLDDYGVMISGLSGAGKSTLAAWCAHLGMDFVGDDRVVISMQNGQPIANPVYTTVSTSEQIADFPARVVATNIDRAKDIFVFNPEFKFRHDIPIRAIIEPMRGNYDTPRIVTAPRAGIMAKIVMDYSNMGCLINSPNPINDWHDISKLFQGVEFYHLHLGRSIADNANAICEFIKQKGKKCI